MNLANSVPSLPYTIPLHLDAIIPVKELHTLLGDVFGLVTELRATILSGGMTNRLYRVAFDTTTGNNTNTSLVVVVRVYGELTERIIVREREFFWHAQFIGTFARFINGLVYEYYSGVVTLTIPIWREHLVQLAEHLATFHARTHKILIAETANAGCKSIESKPQPHLWGENYCKHALVGWLSVARSVPEVLACKVVEKAQWALKALHRIEPLLSFGICHNDITPLNILVDYHLPLCPRFRIIDFDYVSSGFYLFDVATIFSEFSFFLGPSAVTSSECRQFVSAYMKAMVKLDMGPVAFGPDQRTPATLEQSLVLIEFLQVLTHLIISIWGATQLETHKEEMEYSNLLKRRLKLFNLTQGIAVQKVSQTFGWRDFMPYCDGKTKHTNHSN